MDDMKIKNYNFKRDNFKYSKRIIVVDEDDKEDGKKGQRIFCDVEKR